MQEHCHSATPADKQINEEMLQSTTPSTIESVQIDMETVSVQEKSNLLVSSP